MRASVDQRRTDKQLQPAAKKGARVGRPCLGSCAWLLCAPRPSQILHHPPPPFAMRDSRARGSADGARRQPRPVPPAARHRPRQEHTAPAAPTAGHQPPPQLTWRRPPRRPPRARSAAHIAPASAPQRVPPSRRSLACPPTPRPRGAPHAVGARRACWLSRRCALRLPCTSRAPAVGAACRGSPICPPPPSPVNADSVFPKGSPEEMARGGPGHPAARRAKVFFWLLFFYRCKCLMH